MVRVRSRTVRSRGVRIVAALAALLLVTTVVYATPLPPASDGLNDPQFEYDGNVLEQDAGADGALDWDGDDSVSAAGVIEATRDTTDGSATFGECTQTNLPATAGSTGVAGSGLLICDGAQGVFDDQDHFTQGSKNEGTGWVINPGSSPKKSDLAELFLYAKFGDSAFDDDPGPEVADDLFIFSGMTRLDVNGSTHMDIELNQAFAKRDCTVAGSTITCPDGPRRTPGDLLIAVDLERGGIPAQRVFIFCDNTDADDTPECQAGLTFAAGEVCANAPQVTAPCLVEITADPTAAQGTLNTSEILGPSWQVIGCEKTTSDNSPGCRLRTEVPAKGFQETYTDLTAFGIEVTCPGFSNVIFKTRASNELNSELKDDAEGVVNISKCSIAWEKRDDQGALQGGATFTVGGASGPFACLDPDNTGDDDANPVTVVDNGTNDSDPAAGSILLDNVCFGTYTVTETISPSGFALDDDTTRSVTVDSSEPNPVIGVQGADDPGDTDESDFHNRLGTIEWEKRDGSVAAPHPLQGGATFTVGGTTGPFDCYGDATNPVTVVDGGTNDSDADAGQLKLVRVCLGTYTITETVPPSDFLVDTDTTRSVTVSAGDLSGTVGTEPLGAPPGTDDEGTRVAGECTDEACDYHNRRGSIVIRKEAKNANTVATNDLLGGAKFTITPNPFTGTGSLSMQDDDADDSYATDGMICLNNVIPGSYTISEDESFTTYKESTAAPSVASSSDSCAGRKTGAGNDETAVTPDATFENIPLSEIEVIFRSLAGAGITQLTTPIVCDSIADTDADSAGPFDDGTLDRDEVFTNLEPGTYTCIIVIDP